MKYLHSLTFIGLLAFAPFSRAATITVTNIASPGAGSLDAAISALADGDIIAFNIPGAGPHYLITPAAGYPFITNHNVTIDGYTQPGSAANTNTILGSNTAVIKIVLDSSAGGGTAGGTFDGVNGTPGFGPGDMAMLFVKGANNVHIRGLSFMGAGVAGIAVDGRSHHFHLSGCWVGVDPDRTTVSYLETGIAVQGNNSVALGIAFATNAVIGVAAGTTNLPDARAQFNVIGRHGGNWVSLQGRNMRFSGNFFGILPDGMTNVPDAPVPDSVFENGRGANNLMFGTDGDGISDAEERNIVGGVTETEDAYLIGVYGGNDPEGAATNMVFAGNYFGVAVDGVTRLGNSAVRIFEIGGTTPQWRVGSDFNGVSDALEANKIYDSLNFEMAAGADNSRWISLRGNQLVNNGTLPLDPVAALNVYDKFIDTGASNDITPVLATSSTVSSLSGSCGLPLAAPFTRVIVDLYVADPEGDLAGFPQGKTWLGSFQESSSSDSNPAVGEFTFNIASLGIAAGTKVTVAVTYSGDAQPQITGVSHDNILGTTTLTISGGTPNYNIQRASVVNGPYTNFAVATGTSKTFADPAGTSFYRVVGGSASGQTSPFATSVPLNP